MGFPNRPRKTHRRAHIIRHTTGAPNTIRVSLALGKGCAFVVLRRHPPILNHLYNTGKCRTAARSGRALGTEVAKSTGP